MKTFDRLISMIAALTLLSMLALAAPKADRANKYFKVAGKVIQVDNKDRTLLVSDRLSNRLYLIEVPQGTTFKITFGRYMRMTEPELEDVRTGERIEIRCKRGDTEHLSRLDDGRTAMTVTAAP